MSVLASTVDGSTRCSGLAKGIDPYLVPNSDPRSGVRLASPKSQSTAASALSINTFWGLTPRCTIPRSCTALSAERMWRRREITLSCGCGGTRRSAIGVFANAIDFPGQISLARSCGRKGMTKYGLPSAALSGLSYRRCAGGRSSQAASLRRRRSDATEPSTRRRPFGSAISVGRCGSGRPSRQPAHRRRGTERPRCNLRRRAGGQPGIGRSASWFGVPAASRSGITALRKRGFGIKGPRTCAGREQANLGDSAKQAVGRLC